MPKKKQLGKSIYTMPKTELKRKMKKAKAALRKRGMVFLTSKEML